MAAGPALELCLSAALHHAVERISRQDGTLFDQMERQKQVAITVEDQV
jgi:hypothetical protein